MRVIKVQDSATRIITVGGSTPLGENFTVKLESPAIKVLSVASQGPVGPLQNWIIYTTPKTDIVDNRIELARIPYGDILLGKAIVYNNSVTYEYDGVTTESYDGKYFARLNEPFAITGLAVVSYLTKE